MTKQPRQAAATPPPQPQVAAPIQGQEQQASPVLMQPSPRAIILPWVPQPKPPKMLPRRQLSRVLKVRYAEDEEPDPMLDFSMEGMDTAPREAKQPITPKEDITGRKRRQILLQMLEAARKGHYDPSGMAPRDYIGEMEQKEPKPEEMQHFLSDDPDTDFDKKKPYARLLKQRDYKNQLAISEAANEASEAAYGAHDDLGDHKQYIPGVGRKHYEGEDYHDMALNMAHEPNPNAAAHYHRLAAKVHLIHAHKETEPDLKQLHHDAAEQHLEAAESWNPEIQNRREPSWIKGFGTSVLGGASNELHQTPKSQVQFPTKGWQWKQGGGYEPIMGTLNIHRQYTPESGDFSTFASPANRPGEGWIISGLPAATSIAEAVGRDMIKGTAPRKPKW